MEMSTRQSVAHLRPSNRQQMSAAGTDYSDKPSTRIARDPSPAEGGSLSTPLSQTFLPHGSSSASNWRIRCLSGRRRILANHAGLVGEVVIGPRRTGDGNSRDGVRVDAVGGVTGSGRIGKAVSAFRAAGQNAVNETRSS